MKRIMIVDDDTSLTRTLELYFRGKNYDVSIFRTAREALERWRVREPDLILLDVQLPDMDGPEVLENAKREELAGEVVMITAFHDTEATLKAIKLGAADYLYKPIDLDALDLLLEKILLRKAERERQARLSHVVSMSHKPNQIIGRSKAMLEVIKAIAQVAQTPASVLLEGETGTGKELVAQTIHQESAPEDPFVAINCAAIVENLLESELFGHERGAFTGAIHRKIGKLEIAGKGTVFLDEIAEFPVELQAKLLRVLQEREFHRVGGLQAIPMQARVIAATNRNLEAMVEEGAFREDLYFRLKVFVIRIPPLAGACRGYHSSHGIFCSSLESGDGQEGFPYSAYSPRCIEVLRLARQCAGAPERASPRDDCLQRRASRYSMRAGYRKRICRQR